MAERGKARNLEGRPFAVDAAMHDSRGGRGRGGSHLLQKHSFRVRNGRRAGFSDNFEVQKCMQQAWGPSTGQWGSGSSGLERGDEWASGLLASKPSVATRLWPCQELATLEKPQRMQQILQRKCRVTPSDDRHNICSHRQRNLTVAATLSFSRETTVGGLICSLQLGVR